MSRDDEFLKRMAARKAQSEQATVDEKTAAGMREFAAAIGRGEVHPLDRFRREVKIGQYLTVHRIHDVVYEVVDIKTPIDPRVPLGVLVVEVSTQYTIQVMANQQNDDFMIVGARAVADAKGSSDPPPNGNGPERASAPTDDGGSS
jgi:hypothetical protein